MKTQLIFLSFFILQIDCSGQIPSGKLKEDFLNDSLGCNGLRLNHILSSNRKIDKKKRNILVGGINFIDQTKDSIIHSIGNPNETSVRSEYKKYGTQAMFIEIEHLWYYLNTCGKDKKGKILSIVLLNGKVDEIDVFEKEEIRD